MDERGSIQEVRRGGRRCVAVWGGAARAEILVGKCGGFSGASERDRRACSRGGRPGSMLRVCRPWMPSPRAALRERRAG